MKPYPWNSRRTFGDRMALVRTTRPFAIPLVLLSVLANPLTILVHLWCFIGFKYFNDRWSKRGLISIAVGALIMLVSFSPSVWVNAAKVAVYAPGDKATKPFSEAIPDLMMASLGPAVILAGIAGLIISFQSEWEERRYLEPTRPTLLMRLRAARNRRALSAGQSHKGYVPFGTIADDPMPWRTPRHGMVVERPLNGLGHGGITGANGSGKTIAGLTFAHGAVKNGASLLYVDCKGSIATRIKLQNIAHDLGVPFQSFDMTPGSPASSCYDALDWDGSPSEKTSMLMGSFSFPTEGPASHYTDLAQAWLTLQFTVLEEVGTRPDESKFDFLLDTCTPARLKDRIAPLRDGTTRQQALYEKWSSSISGTKADNLSGLRSKIEAVVNAAGERLRPNGPDSPSIHLRSLDEQPSIIHIGLSAVTDDTALKVLGSLAIKDLSVFSGERYSGMAPPRRDIVVIPDEASRMGDRTEVMDNLFTLAREARIWVWPITQSFSTWPEVTVSEMVTNSLTQVVCRLPDKQTADSLLGTLGERRVLNDMREERVRHRMFRAERVTSSSDARSTVTTEPFLLASALTDTADHHAYIWALGASAQPTRKRWKPKRLKFPDENTSDTPLVRIVPPAIVLEDTLIGDATPSEGFNDYVQQFDHDTPTATDHGTGSPTTPNTPAPGPAPAPGWDTGNNPPSGPDTTIQDPTGHAAEDADQDDEGEGWSPPGWDTEGNPTAAQTKGDSISEELTPEQAAKVAAVRDRRKKTEPRTEQDNDTADEAAPEATTPSPAPAARKRPQFVVKHLDSDQGEAPAALDEGTQGEPELGVGGDEPAAEDGAESEWVDDGATQEGAPTSSVGDASDPSDGDGAAADEGGVTPGWDSAGGEWADDGKGAAHGGGDSASNDAEEKGQSQASNSSEQITPPGDDSSGARSQRGGKGPRRKGIQADHWTS